MGRDDHKNSKGKSKLAQTPKKQIAHNLDIEFSEEFADQEDKDAQKRAHEAHLRVKRK